MCMLPKACVHACMPICVSVLLDAVMMTLSLFTTLMCVFTTLMCVHHHHPTAVGLTQIIKITSRDVPFFTALLFKSESTAYVIKYESTAFVLKYK